MPIKWCKFWLKRFVVVLCLVLQALVGLVVYKRKEGNRMKISIKRKNVYGNELIYVIGQGNEAIRALTGKVTVKESDLQALKQLGHEIVDLDGLVNNLE